MFKKLVYVEEALKGSEAVAEVLVRLSSPEVIYIPSYKALLNQTSSDWGDQKSFQKIVLAHRNDNFLYEGSSVTPHFGYTHFYYNTLALNCVYDCDYCYLQGMFNTPHLVLFLNQEDFMQPVKKICEAQNENVYLALSYDTDLPAIENIFPYCKTWIDFARKQNNLIVEIRTKSVNIQTFLKMPPAENVILAWTLSPQAAIDFHEPLTPPLFSRLKAIKKVMDKGWNVRICIDPILQIPQHKTAYTHLIHEINEQLNINQIHSFSLGVFRMNADFLKRMKKQKRPSSVLYASFEKENDVVTYPHSWKSEMLDSVAQTIRKYANHALIEII